MPVPCLSWARAVLGRVRTTSLVWKARKAISAVLEPSGQARPLVRKPSESELPRSGPERGSSNRQKPEPSTGLPRSRANQGSALGGTLLGGYDNRVTAIYLGSFVLRTLRPVDVNILGS